MAHENVKECQAFVMNTEPNPDPCVRYRLRLNLVHFLYSVLKEAVSSMDSSLAVRSSTSPYMAGGTSEAASHRCVSFR